MTISPSVLLQRALFHSFLWLSNIPLYPIIIHSPADGRLDCFCDLAAVNIATVNIRLMCLIMV